MHWCAPQGIFLYTIGELSRPEDGGKQGEREIGFGQRILFPGDNEEKCVLLSSVSYGLQKSINLGVMLLQFQLLKWFLHLSPPLSVSVSILCLPICFM